MEEGTHREKDEKERVTERGREDSGKEREGEREREIWTERRWGVGETETKRERETERERSRRRRRREEGTNQRAASGRERGREDRGTAGLNTTCQGSPQCRPRPSSRSVVEPTSYRQRQGHFHSLDPREN